MRTPNRKNVVFGIRWVEALPSGSGGAPKIIRKILHNLQNQEIGRAGFLRIVYGKKGVRKVCTGLNRIGETEEKNEKVKYTQTE